MNGIQSNQFMRDTGAKSQTLTIEVWPDGSAKASVDGMELMQFVKAAKESKNGVLRIVRMLREAATIIESGIV